MVFEVTDPNMAFCVRYSLDGKRCYFCDLHASDKEQEESAGEKLHPVSGIMRTDSSGNIQQFLKQDSE